MDQFFSINWSLTERCLDVNGYDLAAVVGLDPVSNVPFVDLATQAGRLFFGAILAMSAQSPVVYPAARTVRNAQRQWLETESSLWWKSVTEPSWSMT